MSSTKVTCAGTTKRGVACGAIVSHPGALCDAHLSQPPKASPSLVQKVKITNNEYREAIYQESYYLKMSFPQSKVPISQWWEEQGRNQVLFSIQNELHLDMPNAVKLNSTKAVFISTQKGQRAPINDHRPVSDLASANDLTLVVTLHGKIFNLVPFIILESKNFASDENNNNNNNNNNRAVGNVNEVDTLQRQVTEKDRKITELTTQLAEKDRKVTELTTKLRKKDTKIKDLITKIKAIMEDALQELETDE